jgi:hypothetical protein
MIASINRNGARWLPTTIGLMIFSTSASAECVSREACINSHQGYCKYHQIGKEQCWYPTRDGKPLATKSNEVADEVSRASRQKLDPKDDPNVWPKPSEWNNNIPRCDFFGIGLPFCP